jgi:hypothetical protein
MSLYKTNTINPLNVTDERVVPTIPPYFTKIILNKSTKNAIRSSNPVLATLTKQIKQIDQWIYLHLEGRYGIQKQIVTTDEQVYITSESKQRRGGRLTQDELFDIIWYIEWQVGFEIPNEASYFALSCEYLN